MQKKYKWEEENDSAITRVWYNNTKEMYRQTIHKWRSNGRYPDTITQETWSKWTKVWSSQPWKDKTTKYKANKHSEPAGLGTGQTKHTGGLKSYGMHVVDLIKNAKLALAEAAKADAELKGKAERD
ncbi:uncharacterized protein [Henckelia pumila]|uniref:uncharacterized protein n=1 Tax=Henckelia pumila TaxID=405737 RepID=UPI003C6E93A0